MLVKYVLSDDISQAFLPFRFVDVIVITDHDLFWNVGQANCIAEQMSRHDTTVYSKYIELDGMTLVKLFISLYYVLYDKF
jgi:hypothetical protein